MYILLCHIEKIKMEFSDHCQCKLLIFHNVHRVDPVLISQQIFTTK